MEHNIPELVAQLTLEEKAGLCSGADFWHTKAVERLGIPTLMVSDGPHGLRTLPRHHDHKAVQLQHTDRLADRGTRNAELICQPDLHQPFTRL